MASSKFKAFWNHPAGPKTIVATTAIIWSRYSMVIIPKNWNLLSVKVAQAGTGIYQISRKLRHDLSAEKEAAAAVE